MRESLNSIRKIDDHLTPANKMINTMLILILGIALGVFSKWLDNLSIDNTIWWMNIIDRLGLNNFFSEMAIWLFMAIIISVFSKSPLRASVNTL